MRWYGSIPACAGEPPTTSGVDMATWVYPRVCGGTFLRAQEHSGGIGLSPRVRGNRRRAGGRNEHVRSIPACAGEPASSRCCCCIATVYPRVCGGTAASSSGSLPLVGLSPRVRGNRARRECGERRGGSIPACAGEPSVTSRLHAAREVYPRVCGGTEERARMDVVVVGLSPRVRGNLGRGGVRAVGYGSIPACAGEPLNRARGDMICRVYPRVCGGTILPFCTTCSLIGLSPRVRGNPSTARQYSSLIRSIPACAGEPSVSLMRVRIEKVYPRVCGGTICNRAKILRHTGLSPRVRGNQSPGRCGEA